MTTGSIAVSSRASIARVGTESSFVVKLTFARKELSSAMFPIRYQFRPSIERLESRLCFDGMPAIWMEDNNLGVAGGLPSDFVSRFQDPETWQVALRTIDTLYLRESSLRNIANGIDESLLQNTIAPVLNASHANVALDSGAATFLHRRARANGVSLDRELESHFQWLDQAVSTGLRIRTISLQSVLSKTAPGDASWSSYSVQDRIGDVFEYALRLAARYPWIGVGIIDALPTHEQAWENIYRSLKDGLASRNLQLDHVHLDMPADYIGVGRSFEWSDVYRIQRFVQLEIGSKFGMILTSIEGGEHSNDRWAQRTITALNDYQVAIRGLGSPNLQPDRIIVSSWYSFPTTSVPETMPEPIVPGVPLFKLRNTTQVVVQASNLLRSYEDFAGSGLQVELLQVFPKSASASSSNTTRGYSAENVVYGLGVVNSSESLGQFQWQASPGDSTPWLKATLPRQTGLGTIRLWPFRGAAPQEGGAIADVYVTSTGTANPVTEPNQWTLVQSMDLRSTGDKYVEASLGFHQATAVAVRFRDAVGLPGLAAMRLYATVPGHGAEYVSPLDPTIPRVSISTEHVVSNQAGIKVASFSINGLPASNTHYLAVSDSRFELRGNSLYLRAGVSLNRNSTPGVAVWVLLTDRSIPTKSFSKLVSFLVYESPLPVASSDYGDAPSTFPVLENQRGASHMAQGPTLGASRSAELDGQPSDLAATALDDDGVAFHDITTGTVNAKMVVQVNNAAHAAYIQAWIDFNGDGSWSADDEQIVSNFGVVNGQATIPFTIPADARPGISYARIRISTQSQLTPYGRAPDGEVEDYKIVIRAPIPSTGSFQSRTVSTNTNGARMVQPVDFDRDGDVDIVSVAEFDNSVSLLINDGQQVFSKRWSGTADFVTSALPIDIDQDGDLDILASAYGNENLPGVGNEILLFRNNGGYNFTRLVIASGLLGPYTVTAADMDRDGDLDPVIAATRGNSVKWLENQGNNSFISRDVGSLVTPYFLAIADMDQDGDQDIIATEPSANSIRLFLNNGQQVFAMQSLGNGLSGILDAKIADMDSDGDLDVIASHSLRNELVLFENRGQLSFSQIVLSNQAPIARQLLVADINGDNLLDIVAAQTSENAIVWHQNMGRNIFAAHTLYSQAQTVQHVSSMDMDGDGDLDILSASWSDDSIRWFEQTFEQTSTDSGDAPVTFGEAWHSLSSLYIGDRVDPDPVSHASANADADDRDLDGDDDDGIAILSTLRSSHLPYSSSIHAKASGEGFLDAWIDFNGNGQFDPVSEHLFHGTSVRLNRGSNFVTFEVPAFAVAGVVDARFRLSKVGGLSSSGHAADGEVEDYQFLVEPLIASPLWCTSLPSEIGEIIKISHSSSRIEISAKGIILFDQSSLQDLGPFRVDGNDQSNVFEVHSTTSTPTLTINGGPGIDTLRMRELNGVLNLSDNSSLLGVSLEYWDTYDQQPQTVIVSNTTSQLFSSTQSVSILSDPEDRILFDSDWTINSPTLLNNEFTHRIHNQNRWVTLNNNKPWTNPVNPLDVNANGLMDPLDVLILVNFLNSQSALPPTSDERALVNWSYLDTDQSGSVDPLDVLSVVNAINRAPRF